MSEKTYELRIVWETSGLANSDREKKEIYDWSLHRLEPYCHNISGCWDGWTACKVNDNPGSPGVHGEAVQLPGPGTEQGSFCCRKIWDLPRLTGLYGDHQRTVRHINASTAAFETSNYWWRTKYQPPCSCHIERLDWKLATTALVIVQINNFGF